MLAQNIVLANRADHLFVASLCVASSTAACIRDLGSDVVTFVETGVRAKGGGEEDVACADYISSLLIDAPLDLADIRDRVLGSHAAAKFSNPGNPDFPGADLEHALKIDQFPFAMKVGRENGLLVLRSVR